MSVSKLSASLALPLFFALSACSADKQVPFGLEDSAPPETSSQAEEASEPIEDEPERPTAEVFEPGRVEIPVGETTMVLDTGYALAALEVDLDGDETPEVLALSADTQRVRLHAARAQGLDSRHTEIDAFVVPEHCLEPVGTIEQLSPKLALARVEHRCASGMRSNHWLVTLEAQPRVRERITVLGPNVRSSSPMELALRSEDIDADGYEDLVAELTISNLTIPLSWLDRAGGLTRDGSQPETAFQQSADEALEKLASDPAAAGKAATELLEAYVAICREGGAARIGLSGTQGLLCGRSAAVGRASSIAIEAAIRQRRFVEALGLERQSEASGTQLDAKDAKRVRSAWRNVRTAPGTRWRTLLNEPSAITLSFDGEDQLLVGGAVPRRIELSSGTATLLAPPEEPLPIVDPSGKLAVRSVRHGCQGIEAELRPIGARKSFRVPIAPEARKPDCVSWNDRPVSLLDWQVLGWAPQGLVVAKADGLRIVPLDARGRPAGPPSDLNPDTPLPAPIRGPAVSPDGSNQAIAHREGIVLRSWGQGENLWLRPGDWDAVPGELRAIAVSPSARRIAIQKGSAIQLLDW